MGSYLPIIIIIVLVAVVIPVWLKKRKSRHTSIPISAHKNKDEVWKAVKQYLRDINDNGKEITECFVAKRNDIDFINNHSPSFLKQKKKAEIQIRKWQLKQHKQNITKQQTKVPIKKQHDLYVVCFTTRSVKTHTLDAPRAIECEVINTKVNKKTWDRKILINGSLNYDKEMEWIAPIRAADALKNARNEKLLQKQAEKQRKRLQKEQAKKEKKQNKKTKITG